MIKITILAGMVMLFSVWLGAATWTRAVNSNWHEPGNWDTGVVPDMNTAAYIPQLANPDRYPLVEITTADCSTLEIASEARLYIYNERLIVRGDLLSSGFLLLYASSNQLSIAGDAIFASGSETLFYTPEGKMTCYGDATFASGADFNNLLGIVEFAGSTPATLTNLSANLRFNELVIDRPQSSGNSFTIASETREDFWVHRLTNLHNSKLVNAYGGQIFLTGDLDDQNTVAGAGVFCNAGTLVAQGANAGLAFANAGSYLHELRVGAGHLSLGSDIVVKSDLTIDPGAVLEANTHKISIAGDWDNQAGPDGFLEESGTVEFNGGPLGQYVFNSETFNELLINNEYSLIIPATRNVTCASYTWNAGKIVLFDSSFNAMDLSQNSILGGFDLTDASTVDLHQDGSGGIDLCAEIQMIGGTFSIHGGSGDSQFRSNGQGDIYLSGSATLDFVDQGIDLGNYSWAVTIDNGTIRTAGNFLVDSTDLVLNSGQIELYGESDSVLDLTPASHLHKLVINKASGTRANTVTMMEMVRVYDDLLISSGTLDVNGNSLLVMGNLDIHGSLKMTTYASLAIAGDVNWHPGSQATIGVGDITCGGDWLFAAGCAADLSGSSVSLYNATLSNIHALSADANFGSLVLSGGGTVLSYMGGLPLIVTGDLEVNAPNTFELVEQVCEVSGNTSIESGAALNVGDGGILEIQGNLDLAGTLITGPGSAIVHGSLAFPATGVMDVDMGLFKCDLQNPTQEIDLLGRIDASGAVLEFFGTSVRLENVSNTFNLSTFKAGVDFRALEEGAYQPSGGSLRLTGGDSCAMEISSGNYLSALSIEKQSNACVVGLLRNAHVQGGVSVGPGTLLMDGSDLSCEGSVNISGILELGPRSELRIMGLNVSLNEVNVLAGGIMQLLGDAQNAALISRIPNYGYYTLSVESGAMIFAEHIVFEYMDEFGVNVKPGALVDPNYSFSNCTFREGRSGGTLLTLDNAQLIEIRNAVFPANTWGGASNAAKNLDQGSVVFLNSSGDFSGEDHDSDPHNRLDWYTLYPVSGLSITKIPPGNLVELTWDECPGCDYYRIYYSSLPEGPFEYLMDSYETNCSYESLEAYKFFYVTEVIE